MSCDHPVLEARTQDAVTLLTAQIPQYLPNSDLVDAMTAGIQDIERLRLALRMIAEETVCPDLWREVDRKDWSEGELAHRTALVIANTALEVTGASQSESPSTEPVSPDGLANEELQAAMLNPATQVMFRAGLLACREYMAAFVESENPGIAASIRGNWWPSLGADPGRPRRLRWKEFYEGEYPDGRCKTKEEVSPSIEALVHAMGFLMSKCNWPLEHPCFGESQSEPPEPDGESQSEPPEPDGECFRGGEAAAYNAEEQARIQRELK